MKGMSKIVCTATGVRQFRDKYRLTQVRLAEMLGCASSTVSHLESGKSPVTLMVQRSLRDVARELDRTVPRTRWAPPLQTPPSNRQEIRCPFIFDDGTRCNEVMYRGIESKDPDSGTRLWRMFCKGRGERRHRVKCIYVDDYGHDEPNPAKSQRRRFAPFEKREGLARCTACQAILQWQEEYANRWGYAKLYCFRCTNSKCPLDRKRVYRDAAGKPVSRPDWIRRQRPLPRWADRCPVPGCGGRLWCQGGHRGKKQQLRRVICQTGLKTPQKHEENNLEWPITFYLRPARKEFFVFGLKRRPDGTRELLSLGRWRAHQSRKLTLQTFLEQFGAKWFTVRQAAGATGLHTETIRQKVLDMVRAGTLESKTEKRRKKKYRLAKPLLEA